MNPATNPRWNRKRFLVVVGFALLLALGVSVWWRERRVVPAGTGPVATPLAAVDPVRGSKEPQPETPSAYVLFEANCPVLAVRDEPAPRAGESRRAWLVELAPFGRVRVEETITRDSVMGAARVMRRDAFVAGEVLVTPRPEISAEEFAVALQRAGASGWKRVPATDAWLATFPAPDLDTLPTALAALTAESSMIVRAEGNGIGQGARVPNDARFGEQYSLLNTGQTGGVSGADVRATGAWDIRTTAPDVVVATLDSGIDYNHPELAPNVYLDPRELANGRDDDGNGFVDDARGWDFVNGDNDPLDDHNHGSHVAGIIGAKGGNGTGTAGLAWDVQILPVKILNAANGGTTADLLSGLNYARVKGAKVMNLSLINYPFNASVSAAIDAARDAGVLLVISAGNSGTDNDAAPNYPSSYPQDNVISVANTTNADVLNTGSNFGATTVDLAAPGTRVLSTVRDGGFALFTGTSMSAPHVVGTAALLRAMRPDATVADLRRWILETADPLPALTGRCVTGGRLNMQAALRAAQVLPVITSQPRDLMLPAGYGGSFTVFASGAAPLTYQWARNGVAIPGANSPSLDFANVSLTAAGTYAVTVTNGSGLTTSVAVSLSVGRNTARMVALSTRGFVGTGDGILIPGVVTLGAAPKTLLIRAVGPTLGTMGVAGALADPVLTVFNAAGQPILSNDDWSTAPNLAALNAAVHDTGDFALPAGSKDAALLTTLPAGLYTVQATGKSGATGNALVEIYEVAAGADDCMTALSTRGFVGTGDGILIPGVVVSGADPKTLLIRAVGPTLGPMGVAGTLADPVLTIFNAAGQPILSNDDWGTAANVPALTAATQATGEFPLPAGSKDAAALVVLAPGLYTVQATGKGGATGNVLVEIYEVP